MSKNTTMLFRHLKLISQLLLWLAFALLSASLLLVCLLMLTILFSPFLVLIWLSDIIQHKEPELESMLEELEQSILKLEEEKSSTQESSHFLKSLKVRFVAALKMVYGAGLRLSIFLFGTKKLKTS